MVESELSLHLLGEFGHSRSLNNTFLDMGGDSGFS